MDFVKEVWPVMERIITKYREGTRHGIRMEEDGLIRAGEGLDQVTWMDVRVGEILPTPRHGKPVEINAYWYNALRIMEIFASELGLEYTGYGVLADRTRTSFREQFWNEERGCLKDLVSGTKADMQIRCNQIWAVSCRLPCWKKIRNGRWCALSMKNCTPLTDCARWKKGTKSSTRFTGER